MATMSYNEALKIQGAQVAFYHKDGEGALTRAGIDKLQAMTKPCPFDPDEKRTVIEINGLVPRGCDIEKIIVFHATQETVYLALERGAISRGVACETLGIERCDLDEWIKKYEGRTDNDQTRI